MTNLDKNPGHQGSGEAPWLAVLGLCCPVSPLEELSTVPVAYETLPGCGVRPGPLHVLFSFPDTHRD